MSLSYPEHCLDLSLAKHVDRLSKLDKYASRSSNGITISFQSQGMWNYSVPHQPSFFRVSCRSPFYYLPPAVEKTQRLNLWQSAYKAGCPKLLAESTCFSSLRVGGIHTKMGTSWHSKEEHELGLGSGTESLENQKNQLQVVITYLDDCPIWYKCLFPYTMCAGLGRDFSHTPSPCPALLMKENQENQEGCAAEKPHFKRLFCWDIIFGRGVGGINRSLRSSQSLNVRLFQRLETYSGPGIYFLRDGTWGKASQKRSWEIAEAIWLL